MTCKNYVLKRLRFQIPFPKRHVRWSSQRSRPRSSVGISVGRKSVERGGVGKKGEEVDGGG